jgi:hypothetical protein
VAAPGCVLLSADCRQLELRVLAHFRCAVLQAASNLCEAFSQSGVQPVANPLALSASKPVYMLLHLLLRGYATPNRPFTGVSAARTRSCWLRWRMARRTRFVCWQPGGPRKASSQARHVYRGTCRFWQRAAVIGGQQHASHAHC